MGRLMPLLGDRLQPDCAVAERVLGWQGDPSPSVDSVPLRMAGALHALKLDGLALQDVYPPHEASDDALWEAIRQAMDNHEARLLAWLDSPPQTNEVRRAAAILPALAMVAAETDAPVDLLELGASAGLNLRADRFWLRLPGGGLGDPASPVVVSPEWHGPEPPNVLPRIVGRRGVDLTPILPETPDGRLRLLAYLWPDQPDRLQRTEAAIRIASEVPAEVRAGDAGVWLDDALAQPVEGHARVLFHTVAWQYFPKATVRRAERALAKARTPVFRIGMEADGQGDGAAITLTRYPDGAARALGRIDFHGRWVRWRG